MDIKLLVDKWLSNKKKIRDLKNELRETQLEIRRDESSITKHLAENETEESPTIISELHKKEVRIKRYQIEKIFPPKTVERKLVWEELRRNSLTKDFIILNTWKIHRYLKGKVNQAHESFIKTIRELGLTQKSESIKLEVKDLPPNTNNPPSSLSEIQSKLNEINIRDRDYETDEDFHAESDYLCIEEKEKQADRYQEEMEKEWEEHDKKIEFYDKKAEPYLEDYCKGGYYVGDCHNLKIDKEDDKEYPDWIDFDLCWSCNDENEPAVQCLNCFNDVEKNVNSNEETYYDTNLCMECNDEKEEELTYQDREHRKEMNEEIQGLSKYYFDPYDDAEADEEF